MPYQSKTNRTNTITIVSRYLDNYSPDTDKKKGKFELLECRGCFAVFSKRLVRHLLTETSSCQIAKTQKEKIQMKYETQVFHEPKNSADPPRRFF